MAQARHTVFRRAPRRCPLFIPTVEMTLVLRVCHYHRQSDRCSLGPHCTIFFSPSLDSPSQPASDSPPGQPTSVFLSSSTVAVSGHLFIDLNKESSMFIETNHSSILLLPETVIQYLPTSSLDSYSVLCPWFPFASSFFNPPNFALLESAVSKGNQ